jgi:calcineurin-like phosphoesterase family protein
MDVGVDANDYAPVSLEAVIERLSKEVNFNELSR